MSPPDAIRGFPAAPLELAGISVPAGQRTRTAIDLIELADGSTVRLPIELVNGAKAGPRLYLGATIHGDEVNGAAIVARVLRAINPSYLAGSIVAVPVQHPLSFYADHRIPLSQFMKSPLDQAPVDAWTCFPGNLDGNLAEIVAAKLFGLIRQCSAAIDIHTPTRGGRYVPIAILPRMDAGPGAEAAAWIAERFASGYIMKTDRGMYVSHGILCVAAVAAGIPAFTFEIGEGGRLEEDVVDEGVRCVRNAMVGLGMIFGIPVLPDRTFVMRDFLGIRARRGGLLHTMAKLGSVVERGALLARIVDIFGDEAEQIIAPERGVFVRATTLSTVATGERAATLGLL